MQAIIQALESVVRVSESLVESYRADDSAAVTRLLGELQTARTELRDALSNHSELPGAAGALPKDVLGTIRRATDLERTIASLEFEWATKKRFAGQWLRNLFQNIHLLTTSGLTSQLRNTCSGVPAFVVAAGPSLEKNINELRRVNRRGVILAINRTFAPLVQCGITPDFVVALDSQEVVAAHLLKASAAAPTLVARLSCHPRVFDVSRDRTLLFADTIPEVWVYDQLGLSLPFLPSGGTVAQTAFTLAYFMGCNPIILVGQDLAYAGAKSHATDFTTQLPPAETAAGPPRSSQNSGHPGPPPGARAPLEVPGYHGGLVSTTAALRSYCDWYTQTIQELRAKGIRVINATEGGARIQGALQMPLKTAVDRYTESSQSGPISLAVDQTPALDAATLQKRLNSWRDTLRNSERCAARCHRAALAALENPSQQRLERLKRSTNNARRLLQDIEPLIAHLTAELSRETRRTASSAKTLLDGIESTVGFYGQLQVLLASTHEWLSLACIPTSQPTGPHSPDPA